MPMQTTHSLSEGQLEFSFSSQGTATQYDNWKHYRNQFNNAFGGTKAMDFLYLDATQLWMIEVKDYRQHARTKPTELANEIAHKVRDTLAGLVSAQCHANNPEEQAFASQALKKRKISVVLHLEQPATPSKIRPQAIDPAVVQQKLKQQLKAIDPHPRVVNQHNIKPDMSWQVRGNRT